LGEARRRLAVAAAVSFGLVAGVIFHDLQTGDRAGRRGGGDVSVAGSNGPVGTATPIYVATLLLSFAFSGKPIETSRN
jgi:hypothetical protein